VIGITLKKSFKLLIWEVDREAQAFGWKKNDGLALPLIDEWKSWVILSCS
jgi:hypothetical protein